MVQFRVGAAISPFHRAALRNLAVSSATFSPYTMTSDIDGEKFPVTYTVVRSGSTLAVFYAMNALGGKAPEVPAAVMEAQVAKLEKTA
ncbi:hypothetical protein OHB05_40610 [Streptomyces sp. NBC_00638]|uniref:hypothetical protein n=1 Tax=Streptomyces sp. NBC_00638 TaxID=2975794 RepID=UPI002254723F|nr:hypothetical protein [Streptomyces sp. NBC_00638]MCX5008829.1 hypothetical protein [Streptomyces sp. NBC_00638]